MKNVADVAPNAGGEGHTERRLGQNFGEILPFYILHLDEEEPSCRRSQDAGNSLINSTEASLEHGPAASASAISGGRVGPLIDEFESDFLIGLGIQREIDTAHSAERQEFDDPVLAEFAWMHAHRAAALGFALCGGRCGVDGFAAAILSGCPTKFCFRISSVIELRRREDGVANVVPNHVSGKKGLGRPVDFDSRPFPFRHCR